MESFSFVRLLFCLRLIFGMCFDLETKKIPGKRGRSQARSDNAERKGFMHNSRTYARSLKMAFCSLKAPELFFTGARTAWFFTFSFGRSALRSSSEAWGLYEEDGVFRGRVGKKEVVSKRILFFLFPGLKLIFVMYFGFSIEKNPVVITAVPGFRKRADLSRKAFSFVSSSGKKRCLCGK
ncbi:MAG: hypothetical protein LIP00_06430 [Parabacteroides sp.]|nr:hypothetical protein [Parabacteroides sp.]